MFNTVFGIRKYDEEVYDSVVSLSGNSTGLRTKLQNQFISYEE